MRKTCLIMLLLAYALAVKAALAQPPPSPPLQFNFNPPGARSFAMGSTFIGIADDATAAESNPAGLIIPSGKEVSVHLRHSAQDTTAVDPFSSVFGTSTFEDATSGVSFLSYLEPVGHGAYSIYYQQAANYTSHTRFEGAPGFGATTQQDIVLENLGVAGAIKVGPLLSIGGSLRYSQVDLKDETLASVATSQGSAIGRITLDGRKADLTYNLGLLLNPKGLYSAGMVYKRGGNFQLPLRNDYVFVVGNPPERLPLNLTSTQNLGIPDLLGAGISFRPGQLVIGADVVRVRYSRLNITSQAGIPGLQTFDFRLRFPDVTEVHAGFEYSFLAGQTTVSIRGGYYTSPDHDGNQSVNSGQKFVTAGGGVLLDEHLQVDGAFSTSERTREMLVSFVWHF